jgi:hypothetical protein
MKSFVLTLVAALAVTACSAEVAAPVPAVAAVPVDELANARAAAEAAFRNLRKRNFALDACDSAATRIVGGEREAWAQSNGGSSCTVLAVHRPTGQWVIVVRSGIVASNPQARVVVAPNLSGVQKVDYAR